MPQVTVYIREDDLGKWKSLEKKAEFIHNALHGKGGAVQSAVMQTPGSAPVENSESQVRPLSEVFPDDRDEPPYGEIFGYLNPNDLVLTNNGIFDTNTGERLEDPTPQMGAELKKRGRVRAQGVY
jgi:hypothetical protein